MEVDRFRIVLECTDHECSGAPACRQVESQLSFFIVGEIVDHPLHGPGVSPPESDAKPHKPREKRRHGRAVQAARGFIEGGVERRRRTPYPGPPATPEALQHSGHFQAQVRIASESLERAERARGELRGEQQYATRPVSWISKKSKQLVECCIRDRLRHGVSKSILDARVCFVDV